MGAEQSNESKDSNVGTEKVEIENGLPAEVKLKIKLEASTQTDPVEEDGYDMRTPRRQRKLFGVVTVVGKAGESAAVPRVEDANISKRCMCVRCVWNRCVKLVSCKWLEKM